MNIINQPFQIDLFGASVDGNPGYSNLLNFWDQVPLYFSDRSGSSSIKTLSFQVKNQVKGNQEYWTMHAAPAQFLDEKNNKEVIRFPGRLEELVMASLIDIAASEAVLIGENIAVPCYLGDLMRTMSSNGKARCSYTELKQAILVLNKAKYTLRGPKIESNSKHLEWHFSQISEIVSTNSDESPEDDRIMFIFNRLLTEQILKLQLRLYNFDRFKRFQSTASRPLYKRLCLRFIQAATDESYTTTLSTIRTLAGLSTPDDMSIGKRRKPAISCLDELIKEGVLERYELVDSTKERFSSGMRRKMRTIDEKYKLWPTQKFANEQKKASAIINDIHSKWETAQTLHEQTDTLTTEERASILNKAPVLR